jgi:pilus assembly protein CpaE
MGSDQEAASEIREALAVTARARLLAACEEPRQLIGDVLRLRPSAVIIILDSKSTEKDFGLIKELTVACPETAIITAARDASPALILGSMRSGAREFIQLPIIAEELRTVIERVAEFSAGVEKSAKPLGRIIAVFSGKGGAGVSFLGTNLAAAINVPTLLIDLNLQAGDAASFLGLDAKYSLTDFVQNRMRLDDSLMNSLVTSHSPNLALLAAPPEAHEAEEIKPQDVSEILHLLGQRYECIVVDLPHTFDPVTVAAMDLADDILVVLTLDIPGIRSAKRALKVFDRLDYPRRKIHVVVNRWSKNIDVQLHKVESHLGEQLIGFVPNDYKKVMDSINLGQPLVLADPSSKITVEIKRIAALVSPNGVPSSSLPRKKILGGMFGRQTPSSALVVSKMLEDVS